jgi:hypothetical protein
MRVDISRSVALALMANEVIDRGQVDQAAELLSGPLDKMAKAEAAEKEALADEERLRDLVFKERKLAEADEEKGDLDDAIVHEHALEEAEAKRLRDESIIEEAGEQIDQAFDDAIAALKDSGLIEAAQSEEVTSAIVSAWQKRT